LNHDPSFEIRFDSLDFFGSFFYQSLSREAERIGNKNEQEEIKFKIASKLFKLSFNE
jgi:hypothetical protein